MQDFDQTEVGVLGGVTPPAYMYRISAGKHDFPRGSHGAPDAKGRRRFRADVGSVADDC